MKKFRFQNTFFTNGNFYMTRNFNNQYNILINCIMRKYILSLVLFFISFITFAQTLDQKFTQNFKQSQKQAAFQENKGQIVDQDGKIRTDIHYIYNAPGLKVQFKANSWSYELYQLEQIDQQFSEATLQPEMPEGFDKHSQPKNYNYIAHRVDVLLPNANQNVKIQTENPVNYTENFYKEYTPEEGVTNVKSYKKLTYKNVWNNIDIEWVAKGTELKYNIILHPGANPKDIKMAYHGANALQLKDGKLETSVSFALESGIEKNNLTESIPAVFGADGANFTLHNNTVGFNLQGWNNLSTAIIDPQIVWGTYYGGTSDDYGYGIAVDGSGNVLVTGETGSTSGMATTGAHQTTNGGGGDAFVVKFDSSGVRQWGTYYGGTSTDYGEGIVIDGSGNVYVTGNTVSTSGLSTTGAHQTTNGGNWDAFIVKFNSTGVRQWGTYYGGTDSDQGQSIAVDGSGNVLVTGNTLSSSGISTTGAFQTTIGGNFDFDAFIVKFNSSGVRQWGTYYGGTSTDFGDGIAVDGSGNVLVTGYTGSSAGISTTGAFQTTIGGNDDAFVVKFDSAGVRQWGTYYGGTSTDFSRGIAVDGSGNVLVTGITESSSGISTTGAFQTSYGGVFDAFIVKFNSSGVRQWGTYYGGTSDDRGESIAVDGSGNVLVTGNTLSSSGISTTGAHQTSYGGDFDAFIVKFNSSGVRQWGTYYGGTSYDDGRGIAVDGSGNVLVTGITFSTSGISTTGAHQTSSGGSEDVFVAKFLSVNSVEDIKTVSILQPTDTLFCKNDSFQPQVSILNQGTSNITNFYYKFQLQGSINTIDSVLIDTLKPNIAKTINLGKYFVLNNSGNSSLKVYPSFADDTASNDTLTFNFMVNPTTIAGTTSGAATVCSGSNSGNISLTGNTGNVVKWQFSTNNGSSWTDLTNTTTTQSYNNLTTTTLYRAIVQSGVCPQDTSNATTITVDPITVGGTTSGTATVCSGSNTGNINLTGNTGNVVKWQFSTNGGSSWTDIVNTTTSQAYNNLTSTTLYRAIVQSGVCPQDTSNATTINVDPVSVAGTTSGGATVCSGSNSGNINLTGNTGNVVKWQFSTNSGSSWSDITNTTTTQSYNNLTSTTLYRAIVQSGVCSQDTSNATTITVDPVTVAGTTSGASTVCSGLNFGIISLSGNTGNVVKWQFSINSGSSWTDIANTTNSQAYNNLTTTTQFRAIVQSGVCPQDTSNATTITVDPITIAGTTSGTATVCSGSNSGNINLTGNTGSVVKWQFSTNGGSSWTDLTNTTTTQAYNNLTNTTLYRAIVKSGVCSQDTSNATTITVDPVSVAGTTSGTATVCSGSNSGNINLTGNTGNVVKWQFSTNSGSTWTDIANTTTTQAYNNLTTSTLYRAIVQSGVCPQDTSNSTTLTVDPVSVAGTTSGATTVCSGSNSGNINLTGNTGNVVKWQLSANGGMSWSDINSTSTSISYSNITTTTLYRAIVQSGVCPQDTSNVTTITVDPVTIPGTTSGSDLVCKGANSGTITLSGNIGTVVKWQSSTDGTNWNDIANTSNNQGYSNLTVKTLYRAVVKSGVCPEDFSSVSTISIQELPVATFISSGDTICNNDFAKLIFSVSNVPNGENFTVNYEKDGNPYSTNYTNNAPNFTITMPLLTTSGNVELKSISVTSGSIQCFNNTLTSQAFVQVNPLAACLKIQLLDSATSNTIAKATGTVTFDSTHLNFGVYKTLRVNNIGDTALATTNFSLPTGYSSVAPLPAAIAANSFAYWRLQLKDATVGQRNGVINFKSNALNQDSVYSFNVVGRVVCPQIVYVDSATGSDFNTGLRPSIAKKTLQQSVNAICDTGVIQSTATVFNEDVTILNKSITFRTTGMLTGQPFRINNLTINGLGKTVKLNAPLEINDGTLTLTDGKLITDSLNSLHLDGNNAKIDGYNASKYIQGRLKKTFYGTINSIFEAPIGIEDGYRPIELEVDITANPGEPNSFEFELIPEDPRTLGLNKPNGFNFPFDKYYIINRVVANGTVNSSKVRMRFRNDAINDSVTDLNDVFVFKGDGTDWVNLRGSATGNTSGGFFNGEIESQTFTSFSPFVIATGCGANPQPSVDFTFANGCAGDNISFTNTTSIAAGNITTYIWDFGDGSAQVTQNTGPYPPNPATSHTYTSAGIYTVSLRAISNLNCTTQVSKTLIINELPNTTVSANTTICESSTHDFIVNISNVKTGENWSVTYNINGGADQTFTGTSPGNYSLSTAALTSNTNYTFKSVTNTTTGCVNDFVDFSRTITVTPATTASTITGAATVCSGSNTGNITQTVTGNGSIVRWESSINNGATWIPINTTNNSITYTDLTQTTLFRVITKNGVCNEIASNNIEITVTPLPTATIAGSASICQGNQATLLVTVNNVQVGQSWTLSFLEGTTTRTLIGSGSGNFNLTSLALNSTTSITLQSIATTTGLTCTNSALTGNTTANVIVNPLPFATISGAQTVCEGSTPSYTVTVTNVPTGEGWSISATEATVARTLTGTGSGTFNFTSNTAFTTSSTVALGTITNTTTTCNQAINSNIAITVDPTSVGGTVSSNATVCSGSNTGTLTLAGNTGSIVKWQSSVDGGTTWIDIANTTNTYAYSNLTQTTQFRAVVQSGVCPTANSSAATITIQALPTANFTNAPTICNGQNATLTFGVTNVPANETFTITYKIGSTSTNANYTNNAASFDLVLAGLTQNTTVELTGISITSGAVLCTNTGLSNQTSVTVNPLPFATISGVQTVCEGSTPSYTVTVTNVPTGEGWSISATEATVARTLTGTGSGTFNFTSNTAFTTSSTVALGTITNTTTTCNQAINSNIAISVDPTSVGGTVSSNATVCSGSNSGTLTLAGNTGSIVKWQSSVDGGTTWTDITNTTNSYTYNNLTQTTQFRAVVQSGVCPMANSSAATITIQALPTANFTNAPTICNGQNATLTFGVTNVPANETFTITYKIGSTSTTANYTNNAASFDLVLAGLTQNTTVELTGISVTSGAVLCTNTGLSNQTSVTVNPLPFATISGVQTVCEGSTPSYTVTVTNVPTGEGWSISATEATVARTLTGTGSGTFNFTSNTAFTTSSAVALGTITNTTTTCNQAINSNIAITVSPTSVGGAVSSNATVCSGSNSGTLTLAGNTGSIVKWQSSVDGGTTWTDFANTTNSYNYNNLTQTTQFRAVVQSGVCPTANSSAATITIQALPTANFTNAPTICNGQNATLTFGVTNVPANETFTITYKIGSTSTTANYTNNAASFDLVLAGLTQNTTVELTGISVTSGAVQCTNTGLSNQTSVTVNPLPFATISGAQTVCEGSTPSYTVMVTNVPTGEGWSISATEATVARTLTGTGSGTFNFTSNTVFTTSSTVALGTITNTTTTCNQAINSNIAITVNPTSVGGAVSSNATVCSGSNTGTLTLAGNTGSIVKWQSSIDGGTTWTDIANTTNSYAYNNLTQTTQFRAVVQSGVCPTANSSAATITIQALPTVQIAGSTSICAGSTATLQITVANVGGTQNWLLTFLEGTTTRNLTGTGSGNFNLVSQTLNTNTSITLQSIVTTSGLTCSNTSLSGNTTANVTVNPNPMATISGASTVCQGSTATYSVVVSNVPTGQNWSLNVTENTTNRTLTGTGSGIFNFTSTATFASNANITLTQITNTSSSPTCATTLNGSIAVTVSPTTVAGTTSGAATVCLGSNSGTVSLGGNTGTIVKWQYSTDAGANWFDIAATSLSIPYSNLTVTTQYRAVVKSGVCPEAASTATTITVRPLPTVSINAGTSICAGSTANLTLTVANTFGSNWTLTFKEGTTTRTLNGTGNGNFTLTTLALNTTTDVDLVSIVQTSSTPTCTASLAGNRATVTVNPNPMATISGASTVCQGSTATYSVVVSNVPTGQNWSLNVTENTTNRTLTGTGSGIFNFTSTATFASNANITLTQITNTSSSPTCATTLNGSIAVTVSPTTVAGTTSGAATVCLGSNSGTVSLGGNTGTIVKWQYSTDAGANWFDIAATSSSISYSNLTVTTQYRAVVKSGVCPEATSTATTITVRPLPTVSINAGTSICAGSTANLTLTVANTFGSNWTVTYKEGTTTRTINGVGDGNSTLTTQILNTTTDVDLISITQTSGTPLCSNSASGIATVVVNPNPIATISGTQTICQGSTATYSIDVSNVPTGQAWIANVTENGVARNITGTGSGTFSFTTIPSFSTTNSINLNSIVNDASNPKCTTSLSLSIAITVNPTTVAGTLSGGTSVCAGTNTGTLTLAGNTGTVVRWERSEDNGINWIIVNNTTNSLTYSNLNNTTIYRVLVQSGVCTSAYSNTQTINVNPVPLAVIGDDAEICTDASTSLNVVVSNVPTGQAWLINYTINNAPATLTGTGSGQFSLNTGTLTYPPFNVEYRLTNITNTNTTCSRVLNDTANVRVYPRPNVSFSNIDTCFGNLMFFNNLSTIAEGSIGTYEWTFGDGNSSKDINPTHLYSSPGTYSVKLKAFSAFGCVDSFSQNVVVYPVPVADFNQVDVCLIDTMVFNSASVISSGSIVRYDWSFGDGVTDTGITVRHLFATPGVYPVTLRVTSDNGCSHVVTKEVEVFPMPSPNFSATQNCASDSVQFFNSSTIADGVLTYLWRFGDGVTSTLANPRHKYVTGGDYEVTLINFSNKGCTDSIKKTIKVYKMPIPSFTQNNVCIGDEMTFFNTSLIEDGELAIAEWNFGDSFFANGPIVRHTYARPGVYNVTLRITSTLNCVSTIVQQVEVFELPDPTITANGPTEFCFGNSVVLSGEPGLQYAWNTGETTQSITVADSSGWYVLTVTNNNGCVNKDSIFITVFPLPVAFAGNDTTISKGITIQLEASGGQVYSWDPPTGLSNPNIFNPLARPFETTTYILTVIDSNGCEDKDTITITVIPDELLIPMNTITPNNDGKNDNWIIVNLDAYPDCEVTIYNRYGQEVYFTEAYQNDWDGSYNGNPLPEGAYYYTIKFKGTDKVYKGSINILRGRR